MPAESAEPLYIPTDVTPEELFQAIRKLREEAARDSYPSLMGRRAENEGE